MKANIETRRIVLVSVVAACLLALWVAPAASAKQVELDVALGNPVVLAGEKQIGYLRVAMKGFELDDPSQRTPVNVAIVLDKSGSMSGQKITKAKEAAIMAIQRLRPDDIVSVVVYDHTVSVVVPATKVSDREAIFAAIRRINAGGNTALFAGVSKGAHEVRKFLDDQRVNRIILLSDGLANTGPSSPGDLAQLGESLMREGISVTTIGLGIDYNEDLMTRLAAASDGNNYFAEEARDLENVYAREFGEVLSVIAQEVGLRIECAEGVRPVRVLGREAHISGQVITATLNQLYSRQTKYILIEVELPAGEVGQESPVAKVDLAYANLQTVTTDRLSSRVAVSYVDSPEVVESRLNGRVMGSVMRQVGAETNRTAMQLRDQGKVEEARDMLKRNGSSLIEWGDRLDNDYLRKDATLNRLDADNLDEDNWKRQRKSMTSQQLEAVQSLGYF